MDDDIALLKRGPKRVEVMRLLEGGVMMPCEISRALCTYQANVGRVIRDLKKHNLVVCINPGDYIGKYYKLTPRGRKVLKKFDS